MDAKDAPQIIEHIHQPLNFTPLGCKWIPDSAKFCVYGETAKCKGVLELYELSDGKVNIICTIETSSGIKCATICEIEQNLLCLSIGELNGTVSLRSLDDLKSSIWEEKKHKQAVNSIDSCGRYDGKYGPQELLTGSRDGSVRLWDMRTAHEVLSLEAVDGETAADCWSVAFGNASCETERCLVAGYDNGDIKLFDLRSITLAHEENVQNGVCQLQFDRKDIPMNKLGIATLGGYLYMFDTRTRHSKEGFAKLKQKVQSATIWGCQFLPQNREIFAVHAGNGKMLLYKYSYPSQRSVKDTATMEERGVIGKISCLNDKELSSQPLVAYDWHPNKIGLAVVACLDQSVKVVFITKLQQY